MSTYGSDKVFTGSIAELYETYLVPLLFEPYAADLAARLASRPLGRVLEIAAGTGVATRAMVTALPEAVSIVATDLNQAMLDQAAARGTARPVEWRQADAMALPFADGTFDAVVCQFGAMFFQENEFADIVTTALAGLFPDDPPRFLARTPHGYHDHETIKRDLAAGGFTGSLAVTTLAARSRAGSCEHPAVAYCQGTPLRNEIEARDASRLTEATTLAAEAIAHRFGRETVDGKIQAHVVTIAK
jgi:hypothetical protein